VSDLQQDKISDFESLIKWFPHWRAVKITDENILILNSDSETTALVDRPKFTDSLLNLQYKDDPVLILDKPKETIENNVNLRNRTQRNAREFVR